MGVQNIACMYHSIHRTPSFQVTYFWIKAHVWSRTSVSLLILQSEKNKHIGRNFPKWRTIGKGQDHQQCASAKGK